MTQISKNWRPTLPKRNFISKNQKFNFFNIIFFFLSLLVLKWPSDFFYHHFFMLKFKFQNKKSPFFGKGNFFGNCFSQPLETKIAITQPFLGLLRRFFHFWNPTFKGFLNLSVTYFFRYQKCPQLNCWHIF